MNRFPTTIAVLEEEAISQIKDSLNATVYRDAREILLSLGLADEQAARGAARLVLRVKRAVQEI